MTTNSARHQEISLNPQKTGRTVRQAEVLSGVRTGYVPGRPQGFPRVNQPLQTIEGDYFLVKKSDILERTMWFATDPGSQANLVALPVERVREVIRMNQKGNKPERLSDASPVSVDIEPTFANVVGEEPGPVSISRSDGAKTVKSGKRRPERVRAAIPVPDRRKGAREKPASGKPENRRSDKPAPGQQPARKQRVPADVGRGARRPARMRRVATTAVIAVAIRTEDRNRDGQQSGGGKQEKGGAGE